VAEMRRLERECRIFTRYLTGRVPEDYVGRKYLEAFSTRQQVQLAARGRFDHVLLALAGTHSWLTRITDIYSRFFCSDSVVRRRLVMLLAFIESDAVSVNRLDSPTCGGMAGFVIGMSLRGLVSGLLLLPALLTLLPLQLLLGRGNRPGRVV